MTRYDILTYTVDMSIFDNDEISEMSENESYLFEHFCNDICDDIAYSSLHFSFAEKVFTDICAKVKAYNNVAYVYVLCKVENNDICTVIDYSRN